MYRYCVWLYRMYYIYNTYYQWYTILTSYIIPILTTVYWSCIWKCIYYPWKFNCISASIYFKLFGRYFLLTIFHLEANQPIHLLLTLLLFSKYFLCLEAEFTVPLTTDNAGIMCAYRTVWHSTVEYYIVFYIDKVLMVERVYYYAWGGGY